MDIQGIGGLFGLPFKEVYEYLKAVRERREVERQLRNVLQSLSSYKASTEACERSGKVLATVIDSIPLPITLQGAMDLTKIWVENSIALSNVLSSIRTFGNESHQLVSGNFEGFMEKVKRRKPMVHDFLTFFGNNYDPRTEVLDVTALPVLARIYGPQIGWKESKEMSKDVAEGAKTITKAIEKAKNIANQKSLPRIVDRRVIRDSAQTLRRLAKEMKSFHSTNTVDKELWGNAPSWFVEIMEISEQVQKALPELSKKTLVRYRRYRRVLR